LTAFDLDFFVIGGGSGGVRAARIAAGLGARTALAEERYLGGTCVNVGCIPKKLFSYASNYAHDFEDAAGYGWSLPVQPVFDWSVLMTNKDKEIARLNGIYLNLLRNAGVQVFEERATLVDRHTVKVGDQTLRCREILIATGGWPFVPDIPGRELAINSNDAFALQALPSSILIVGGGYIAVEFAGIFAGLGVKTTLAYRGSTLLRGFDTEVAAHFQTELAMYATLRLNAEVSGLRRQHGGIVATMQDGSEIVAEHVLFATGRAPNTAGLGLENAGVRLSANGAVVVNQHFTTSISNIHAVGDVIDRVALTPVALAEGQLLARRLFGGEQREMTYDNIPTAVFCHPEIATVGLSEDAARGKGIEIKLFRSRFTPLRHTLSGRAEKAFLKLVVDSATDKVLGAHMLGDAAAEILQGLAIAIAMGATKSDFDRTLGIHPSAAEEFVTMRTPS
jgi:glutathione reductase (NADPH)